jgi:hypothetical protein
MGEDVCSYRSIWFIKFIQLLATHFPPKNHSLNSFTAPKTRVVENQVSQSLRSVTDVEASTHQPTPQISP